MIEDVLEPAHEFLRWIDENKIPLPSQGRRLVEAKIGEAKAQYEKAKKIRRAREAEKKCCAQSCGCV